MTRLEEIKQRYERLHPDLEVVKEVTYLLRRLEAVEAALKEVLSPTIQTQECAIDAWEKAKEEA